jgi:AraC family transcriptional regulator of adaptative response / DNA-3-methyladenine glycosylase II
MRLDCREPFDWKRTLGFLSGRATPGVEHVTDDAYHRTLTVPGGRGFVSVVQAPGGKHLEISISGIDGQCHQDIVAAAARVFDIDAPLDDVAAALSGDAVLARLLGLFPGVRVPGAWDGFELTIRAILGQQISVKAATTLAGRIAQRYGEKLETDEPAPSSSLKYLFPTAKRLSRAKLDNIGLVRSRAETIRTVASAAAKGDIEFDGHLTPEEFRRDLKSIRGIGEWTAQYVSMRALKDPDAFPDSDLALVKAIAFPERVTPKELKLRAEAWRPYRAYAAMLLWSSLPGSGG